MNWQENCIFCRQGIALDVVEAMKRSSMSHLLTAKGIWYKTYAVGF